MTLADIDETEAVTTPDMVESEEPVTPMTSRIRFRDIRPTEIARCFEIEKASYPDDERASKSSLQYRQHHAASYFRSAILLPEGSSDIDDENAVVIGFVCSTRCVDFTHESMSLHVSSGPLLAIHSVVVEEQYRLKGIATSMLQNYVETVRAMDGGIEKIVLLAKQNLLAFYVKCGFQVTGLSKIVHGSEQWYDLEMDLSTWQRDSRPCYIVDAFADPNRSGSGNPAAVVVCDKSTIAEKEKTQLWMQTVASEFNLSETAFVWPATDTPNKDTEVHYNIRYFTPTCEVPLCGHATLASAAVLYQTMPGKSKHETAIVFHAKEDVLGATLSSGSIGRGIGVTMKFPLKPATSIDSEKPAVVQMIQAAMNFKEADILFVGLSEIGDILVEVTPESFTALGHDGIRYDELRVWDGYTRGVILCCDGKDETSDFVSRFFGPKAGINEDAVTGSAHCVLAPYFAAKLGKTRMVGYQASRRGGTLDCSLEDDHVKITGTVVTNMMGKYFL